MTHLKKLCSLEGVSGREHPVREYILRVLQQSPADMSVRVDPMGNVLAGEAYAPLRRAHG